MELEAGQVEEGGSAEGTAVRVLVGAVQAAVELQVDVLGELGATQLALVGLLA